MFLDGKEIVVTGRFPRIARLRSEYYECIGEPSEFIAGLKSARVGADLLTFIQKLPETKPRYDFHLEWESVAVMPVTTFENWWTKQVNDKTRNMVRRARKNGVEVRVVEFGDELIKGIKGIYDESPLRQGKPFTHYGKDLETLKRDNSSFLDRSQFIGAFYGDELIGFIKLVHGDGVSHLMHIISKISHRDKAPTNALIAMTVEVCAERGIPCIHYADWSRRGLGDFKKHNDFRQLEVPRYYVPLNLRGKMFLNLNIHRRTSDMLPKKWVDLLAGFRSRWNEARYNVRKA